MEMTLDLDSELVSSLQLWHPGYSKSHAINVAVREYLNQLAVSELRSLAGIMEIQDVSDEMRKADRQI